MSVTTGLERFLASPIAETKGVRLGLLTNPSGIDTHFRSGANLIADHPELNLTALYGPEHGVRGEAQAGELVTGTHDQQTGLPVHSLYGDSHIPTAEMLDDIDTMVIDIQDIGARFTTYISTLAHVMDACAEHGKQVVILDRPNPFGGNRVSGNLLDPAFTSFVGIHTVPILHGLTLGEFGRLWARDTHLPDPVVVRMEGWNRDMWFDNTGQPWVFPSPNLPTMDSLAAYPATCFIEGTDLSEGRGTTRPFECIGAPWIEPERLANALRAANYPGVAFRPLFFTPMFSKHAGSRCGGVQLYVQNRDEFDSAAFGPLLLKTIKELYPDDFSWLAPRGTEFFIDKLAGESNLRETIDGGGSLDTLMERWRSDAEAFVSSRSDILHY